MLLEHRENDFRASSRLEVENAIERGFLTKSAISQRVPQYNSQSNLAIAAQVNERFTKNLFKGSYNSDLADYESRKGYISDHFWVVHWAKSALTDVVTRDVFFKLAFQALGDRIPNISEAISILYQIVSWHAAFPFPPEQSDPLTTSSLAKALEILTGSGDMHGGSTRGVGRFEAIITRTRNDQDSRRLLFRSIAHEVSESIDHDTEKLAVVEATYTDVDSSFPRYSQESFDSAINTEIVNWEDERCVDLVDVLALSYPNTAINVARPIRSAFYIAAESLPHYPTCLNKMAISVDALRNLFRLVWLPHRSEVNEGPDQSGITDDMMDRFLSAFHQVQKGAINWTTFDRVVERQFVSPLRNHKTISNKTKQYLFEPMKDILWSILTQGKSGPLLQRPVIESSGQGMILNPSIYAELCSFLPSIRQARSFQPLKLLFIKSKGCDFQDLVRKVGSCTDASILLIQGYATQNDSQTKGKCIVFGAFIPQRWTTSASFPCLGLKSLGDASFASSKRTIIFQLSPAHCVYRGRNTWAESLDHEPMLQRGGIAFGRSLNEAFGSCHTPSGLTSLAVDSTLDQAVFEHGKQDALRGEFEGFLPYSAGCEGEVTIRAERLEVWTTSKEQDEDLG